jgi:hypothetical protein
MHNILIRVLLVLIFGIQTLDKIFNKYIKFHKKDKELDESFVYQEYSGSTLREI